MVLYVVLRAVVHVNYQFVIDVPVEEYLPCIVLGAGVKSSLSNDAPLTQIQTAVLLLHDVEDAAQLSLDDHGDDEGTPDQLKMLDKGGAQVGWVHRSHGTQEPVAGVAVPGHHQQEAFEGHGRSTFAKAQSGHINRRVE